ncbi:TetR/AcrR family transcriptional regulator [Nocardioides marmoribigeumensis]|jgi:AcrR family transcriptional regulator|uniref:AcrR family transcriptional regulator n=1 Tax=Nocardioides marmoribigeumensis TaxID=433649 RepID=A0ABU2BT88_9ACTN|nr:helix-turn-helix domain-containing protein [Nocardioides marmoribigeumensis]MDR7361854.1 AcrR family transcriptional regulator [Nocardioides marmoribigeumensis]
MVSTELDHRADHPRRSLNARQQETVEKLLAAAAEVLEDVGHEQLTIRMVAAHAGVSPATAYTYVASKDHLYAEMFWRMLVDAPGPRLTGRSPTKRMQQTATYLADLITGSPALAAAVTRSLLGTDPEVERLRVEIGTHWVELFRVAIGEDASPDLLMTLAFAFSGALLQSGMGLLPHDQLADQLVTAVGVIMEGSARRS